MADSDETQAPETDPTRERILRAAKEKFLRVGFSRVPIEEVCTDLHIAKKTFYKHFRNRDEVVLSIIVDNMQRFAPALETIFQADLPAPRKIEAYVDYVHDTITKNISEIFMEDVEIHMPELWEKITSFRRAIISRFEQILERGVEEGSVHADVNPRSYTRIILGMIDTVAVGSFLRANDLTLAEVVRTAKRMFLFGLQPDVPSEENHEK
jgi:AcrR family transcriptional regulator